MALTVGTVTVDEGGGATGSGLAFAIFEGCLSGATAESKAQVAAGMVAFCEGLAAAIINHLKDEGVITVTVGVSDSGLQRVPPDTPTLAPAAPVNIGGTIA